jgi:quinoprotein glucose dehydrogenase
VLGQGIGFPPPPGLRVELFAADPLFANPVAISVDAEGGVFVTETRRRKVNALDIRNNPDWLDIDLSLTTVSEKEAFYRRELTPENSERNRRRVADWNGDGFHDWRDLTFFSEVIHLLKDTSGDGRADFHSIFAEGFNTVVTDVAAGLMAHGGDVYATIAPDVWRLRDTDGDGIADERESLAGGFAVHIAYAGHHLQSPRIGMDGRLYWAVGDIGSDYLPNEGAIFRSEPDGSNFEVFARGLRNVHQFVFNEFGDILTADNDSDLGDRERWLHIVEGGEYGWRNWWQYQIGGMWGATPETYPVWNAEGIWHLWSPEQGAWHLPPAAHAGTGPCGMAYYPGTGMGGRFTGHFFVSQFTGNPSNSGIWIYTVDLEGASYRLAKSERWIAGVVPTGIDFSPDGSELFVLDWAGAWDLNDEGRVWRLFDPQTVNAEESNAVRDLLRSGFSQRSVEELASLLAHPNLNARREAQFALVEHGPRVIPTLERLARTGRQRLERVHALWALEQIHRRHGQGLENLLPLLNDPDSEIRAQTAKMLGEGRIGPALDELIRLLEAENERVQFFAAQSLGKLGDSSAVQPLLALLERNGTNDLYLRHAAVHALERIADLPSLVAAQGHSSPSVRLGSLLALRRLERPEISGFLNDPEVFIVTEAARAINDVPIAAAMPALAELWEKPLPNQALARRVLNANFRLGKTEQARRLSAFAANLEADEKMRLEALRLLGNWEDPHPRDHVTGAWRPLNLDERELDGARVSFAERLPELLGGPDQIGAAATRMAEEWRLEIGSEELLAWVKESGRASESRMAALEMLASRQDQFLNRALATATDPGKVDRELFAAGLRLLGRSEPEQAVLALESALRHSMKGHAQSGLRVLAGMNHPSLAAFLSGLLDSLIEGKLDPGLRLEVIEAAARHEDPGLRKQLGQIEAQFESEPLGRLTTALHGGDAIRGRTLFFQKAEIECLRCHMVRDGMGIAGGDAGPTLEGIGKVKSREYLLEAIVNPNAAFAEGYEQVVLTLQDGRIVSGRILDEGEENLIMEAASAEDDFSGNDAHSRAVTILKSEILERTPGISSMPEGFGDILTLFELRDLVEYLAGQ